MRRHARGQLVVVLQAPPLPCNVGGDDQDEARKYRRKRVRNQPERALVYHGEPVAEKAGENRPWPRRPARTTCPAKTIDDRVHARRNRNWTGRYVVNLAVGPPLDPLLDPPGVKPLTLLFGVYVFDLYRSTFLRISDAFDPTALPFDRIVD